MMTSLLREILHLPLYNFISGKFVLIFQYVSSIECRESTVYAAKLGLTLGLGLTTFLEYFPGVPLQMISEHGDVLQKSQRVSKSDGGSGTELGTDQVDGEDIQSFNKIPKDKLDKVQKLYGLSDNQMNDVMEKSKKEALIRDKVLGSTNLVEENIIDNTTLSRKMNRIIYPTLLILTIYFINNEYENAATLWFVKTFPKEARTLKLIP
mmetsp:Transcript_14599/g.20824  ORF Transcript_14599/g.20824 Transcript_14599/m.20824 type:complete len:208 (+) Transcript_14599:138-761(+)